MHLVFFGAPGVGKGTQAKFVSKHFRIPHISTGDMLRAATKEGTELGLKAGALMSEGRLVPDDIMLGIIRERIQKTDSNKGFILDGFPRTLFQASQLDDLIEELSMPALVCIEIVVPDQDVINRLINRRICDLCNTDYNLITNPPPEDLICTNCGGRITQRKDDNRETVSRRLEVYQQQTAPLRAYYQEKGNYYKIDGSRSIAQVQNSISKLLTDHKF